MNKDLMNKELGLGLVWGGGLLAVALSVKFAQKLGYLDSDMATRLVIGANGLVIAWYGNRMPKVFVPNAFARQARRVGGWSMVLSGLAYTGLWAFAPMSIATTGGMAVIMAGIAVTLGYCLLARTRAKAI